MTQKDYEYWGLMASTWDLFLGHTATWEDTLFFRELISRHGQPVLEVGCGTGRLLLDYLGNGIDIDGVDISPEMLAICRDKGQQLGLQPTLFKQPMECLDLPRRYRSIIVPASSFQLVTDPMMAKQTMQRFFSHLKPGGMLAMRFMIPWQEGDPLQTDWKLTGSVVKPEAGAVVRRWSWASYDIENRLEHTEDRYEVIVESKIIASEYHRHTPAARWYTPAQALSLYEEAGFTQLCLLGEQNSPAASAKGPIFAVTGIKP